MAILFLISSLCIITSSLLSLVMNSDQPIKSFSMSSISSFSKLSMFISEKSCNTGLFFSSITNNEYGVITKVNSVPSSSNHAIPVPVV